MFAPSSVMRLVFPLLFLISSLISLSTWRTTQQRMGQICARTRVVPQLCGLGTLEQVARGRWELLGASLEGSGEVARISVFGERDLLSFRGQRVRFCGPMSCADSPRGPAVAEDGLWQFRASRPRFSADRIQLWTVDPTRSLRSWFRGALESSLAAYPSLRALALAVWTADLSFLPPQTIEFYRQAGLLFILALSGQHVVVFALGLEWIGRATVRGLSWLQVPARYLGAVRRGVDALAPVFSALILIAVSSAPSSIRRTAGMVIAVALLRWRGLRSSVFRVIATSAAVLTLADPGLVGDAGFLLSALSTVAVVAVFRSRVRLLYFWASIVVPVAAAPLVLSLFSEVSWLSPLYGLLLNGLWSALWIPLGFLAPGLVHIPGLGGYLESGWSTYLRWDAAWGAKLPTGRVVAYRFSVAEVIGLYVLGWCVISRVISAITKDKPTLE